MPLKSGKSKKIAEKHIEELEHGGKKRSHKSGAKISKKKAKKANRGEVY